MKPHEANEKVVELVEQLLALVRDHEQQNHNGEPCRDSRVGMMVSLGVALEMTPPMLAAAVICIGTHMADKRKKDRPKPSDN